MPKILVADDDEALSAILGEWLRKQDFMVDLVRTGDDALRYLQTFNYDAVVLDWLQVLQHVDPATHQSNRCTHHRRAGTLLAN